MQRPAEPHAVRRQNLEAPPGMMQTAVPDPHAPAMQRIERRPAGIPVCEHRVKKKSAGIITGRELFPERPQIRRRDQIFFPRNEPPAGKNSRFPIQMLKREHFARRHPARRKHFQKTKAQRRRPGG